MNALILCNGEPPSTNLLLHHLAQATLVICTDGAAEWVCESGYQPRLVVGDMDSCDAPEGDCEVVDAGPHDLQENTDAEKALLLALERGATRIVLLGATGRRLDHTLGNVWLAARYHDRAEVLLVDDLSELRVISGTCELSLAPGRLLSLLALTPRVRLDTEGLKWPLHGSLEVGTRGLSNESAAETVKIEVHEGMVALITPTTGVGSSPASQDERPH